MSERKKKEGEERYLCPLPRLSLFLCLSFFSVSLSLGFFFSLCLFLPLCFLCLFVSSVSVCRQLAFCLGCFSLPLCFLSPCLRFLFLLRLSFLCPSVFLFSLSFGVLSLSFFPPPLWFLCLSVSCVFVCCLLAFCLGCPAVLRGTTTKLRISFSGSICYASGGCGSIMLPPSPFTL